MDIALPRRPRTQGMSEKTVAVTNTTSRHTDNAYHNRMAAYREAGHGSRWNIFAHARGRSGSLPQTWQAGNELEGQTLAPSHTAPTPIPPQSSNSEGRETATTATTARPEAGDSRTELRSSHDDAQFPGNEPAPPPTVTQGVLRQRTTAREFSPATAEHDPDSKKLKKSSTFFKHLTPKEPFTVRNQLQRTLLNSWINVLLIAAPAGIAINYVPSVSRVAVFIVNFIAIVPLAAMLGFATEEIALRTGETVGGLLNATFGYDHLRSKPDQEPC